MVENGDTPSSPTTSGIVKILSHYIMDYIAVSGLVIAILGGLGTFFNTLHIRRCNFLCFSSDCMEKERLKYHSSRSSLTNTPPKTPPLITKDISPLIIK